MDSMHLSQMDHKQFSHTAYLVLLYKALEIWSSRTGAKFPSNYKEKEALRSILKHGKRIQWLLWGQIDNFFHSNDQDLECGIVNDEDTNAGDEENVNEAVKAVNTALNKTNIPSSVQKILSDEQCLHLKQRSPFWIMARAVKEFVEKEGNGCLPLRGTLPDMTSDSQRYIALQNV